MQAQKTQKTDKEATNSNDFSSIDYKDVEALKKYLNPHARMLSKKKTNMSAKHQRMIAMAIKRARFMALIPYVAQ
jgi:small subunit ribosomal protein S18